MQEPTEIRRMFWRKNKTASPPSENTKSLQVHSEKVWLSEWMGAWPNLHFNIKIISLNMRDDQ